VIWFNHNDMKDLERVLEQVKQKDIKTKREIARRFIVIEGVYFNFGDICPLPKIMELKAKYCYRLMMDDSYGIGTIGKTGRGTCELYNVTVKDVEFLTGNLAAITSSVGGFCCANKAIVYHQRLNSSGYVYSASLPPLLAAASLAALDIIDQNPNLLTQLQKNVELFHKGLSTIEGITVSSSPQIAVIHLRLAKPSGDRYQDEVTLQSIVEEALTNDVLLTRAKYVHDKETFLPEASIRVTASSANTEKQINQAISVIKNAVAKVIQVANTEDKNQSSGSGVKKRSK